MSFTWNSTRKIKYSWSNIISAFDGIERVSRCSRSEYLKGNTWLIQHDNATFHKCILVRKFSTKNSTIDIDLAPHSPDRVLRNVFICAKLKFPLRETKFWINCSHKQNSQQPLKGVLESAYQKCFDYWIIHWHKCVSSTEAYFEEDNINMDNNMDDNNNMAELGQYFEFD